jgi:exo-beta-1,3-glucanase (GH17 family)
MISQIRSDGASLPSRSCHGAPAWAVALAVVGLAMVVSSRGVAAPPPDSWSEAMTRIRWVCYTSPDGNLNRQIEPTPRAIKEDLRLLRQAGFTGLITYSADGLMGRDFAELASTLGFEGLIIGVWDPKNKGELTSARNCRDIPIVLGYSIGNEGYPKRYTYQQLKAAIEDLRTQTGKPVTTTEEIDDYFADKALLELGDWVCVNAHPFFHNRRQVDESVTYTLGAYQELKRRTDRLIMFKEAGLPTEGAGGLSEENQLDYYRSLEKAKAEGRIFFAYFEGFDLPWKTHLAVEPHWGLFRVQRRSEGAPLERSPKLLAKSLTDTYREQVRLPDDQGKLLPPDARTSLSIDALYIASGALGDIGDLKVGAGEGKAVQFTYTPLGHGPHEWDNKFVEDQVNTEPARQVGMMWLSPPTYWGTHRDGGHDLRALKPKAITFEARSLNGPVWVQFVAGGVRWRWRRDVARHWVKTETFYPDTLPPLQLGTQKLANGWQRYFCRLPALRPEELRRVVGAFGVVISWADNGFGPRSTSEERSRAKFVFEVRNIRLTSQPDPRPPTPGFAVYTDAQADDNHYKPSGLMGDFGDIFVNETWEQNPHSERTCIRVAYEGRGNGPSQPHDYPGPCRWSGLYWQYPANNWGKSEFWNGIGYDLRGAKRLVFWARADKPCQVEFFAGGIDAPYGDSQKFGRREVFTINPQWTQYMIDLGDTDLRSIIGGFGWSANQDANPDGAVFYLDDIIYIYM